MPPNPPVGAHGYKAGSRDAVRIVTREWEAFAFSSHLAEACGSCRALVPGMSECSEVPVLSPGL
jgi:hypothetical protein